MQIVCEGLEPISRNGDTFEDVADLVEEDHGLWTFHLFEQAEPSLDDAEDDAEDGFKKLLTKPENNPKTNKKAIFTKADANPKVAKNMGKEVLTIPLHLAPADSSGHNVCPCSTAGCRKACLHHAGNPVYMVGKERARVARTKLYFEDRPKFMRVLAREVAAHVRKAKRLDMAPAVRLNATSDIPWERVPVEVAGVTYPNIMAAYPEVIFYDYTKVKKRAIASASDPRWPRNYHITFSLSEENEQEAGEVLAAGGTVAVVFRLKRGRPLPTHFTLGGVTAEVIDGDTHDLRVEDPPGVIIGLRAKGRDAWEDSSGFVKDVDT